MGRVPSRCHEVQGCCNQLSDALVHGGNETFVRSWNIKLFGKRWRAPATHRSRGRKLGKLSQSQPGPLQTFTGQTCCHNCKSAGKRKTRHKGLSNHVYMSNLPFSSPYTAVPKYLLLTMDGKSGSKYFKIVPADLSRCSNSLGSFIVINLNTWDN